MSTASLILLLFGPGNLAGYRVYRRASVSAPSELVADLDDDVLSYTVTGLAADSIAYYYVNAVSPSGVESTITASSRLRRVAMDAANELILPSPNPPFALALTGGEGGAVTATWRHRDNNSEEPADGFNVYVATGADPFDFNTPAFAVGAGARSQALGTFADGTTVRCVVRARTDEGVEETNTTEATAEAAAAAPAAPTTLVVV